MQLYEREEKAVSVSPHYCQQTACASESVLNHVSTSKTLSACCCFPKSMPIGNIHDNFGVGHKVREQLGVQHHSTPHMSAAGCETTGLA